MTRRFITRAQSDDFKRKLDTDPETQRAYRLAHEKWLRGTGHEYVIVPDDDPRVGTEQAME